MKNSILIHLFCGLLIACGGGSGGSSSSEGAATTTQTPIVDDNKVRINISSSNTDKYSNLMFSIYIGEDRRIAQTSTWSDSTTFTATVGENYTITAYISGSAEYRCYSNAKEFIASKSTTEINVNPSDFCFDRVLITDVMKGITDANLKSCIYTSDYMYADQVYLVDCDKPIKNLDGLENFRFITNLLLENTGTELTSISLNLPSLYEFRIDNSHVTDISLKSNRLKHYEVLRSPITDLPYSDLKKITNLEISYLELSELNLNELPALEDFDGRGLIMDSLHISNMENLGSVDLENTRATHPGGIKTLSFENNPKLSYIQSTNAEKLTIGEGQTALRSLYCDCPDLNNISIPSTNTDIEYLEIISSKPLLLNVDIPVFEQLKVLKLKGFGIGYNLLDLSLLTQLDSLYIDSIILGDLKLAPSGVMTSLTLSSNSLISVPQGLAQALKVDDNQTSVSFDSTIFKQPAIDEFEALKTTFPKASFRLSFQR
jgi:hypothetical protein